MSSERPASTSPAVETHDEGRFNAPRRNLAPLYAGGLVVLILLVLAMNFGGKQNPKPQPPPAPTSAASDLAGLLEEEAARRQRSVPQRPPTPPKATSVPLSAATEPAAIGSASPAEPSPAGVYDPNRPPQPPRPAPSSPATPPQLPGLEAPGPDRAAAARGSEDRPAVRYRAGSTAAAGGPPSDPTRAALAALAAELPLLAQPTQPAEHPAPPGELPSSRYATFLEAADKGRSGALQLAPELHRDPPAYLLLQGTQIPAVLETAIHSELPGQASGYVRKDVYDTLTGRYLLIPQGSRLLGTYNSDVVWGASRLLLVWNRLILPDGTSYQIVAPSSDREGSAGLPGNVNNHWMKTLGSALMLSAISAGVQISQNPSSTASLGRTPTAAEVAGAAVGQELGQVSGNLIRKNLEIPPSLSLRPGLTYNVVLTRDVVFPHPFRRAQ
ncbi:MAG TPA: TrbI/VirB10 family protein [Thermoanaerobaculia bacterium]|nr:TrbI/VirB10 family protein [Thermoanaerobaculia bacterium]